MYVKLVSSMSSSSSRMSISLFTTQAESDAAITELHNILCNNSVLVCPFWVILDFPALFNQCLQPAGDLTESKRDPKGAQRQLKGVCVSCCISLKPVVRGGKTWLRNNHKNGDKQIRAPEAAEGQTRRRARAGCLPIQAQK